jgi:PPOX class probable F420-dependent enzyme
MPHPMSTEELLSFLVGEPARAAKLATTRADGRPHVAPVWFVVDRTAATDESPLGDIIVTISAESVKGRNLRRDPRAAICIDDDQRPFSFVTIEGTCSLSDDPSELLRWTTAAGGRYMGADVAEEYGRKNGVPGGLVVRVRPTHIVAVANLAN